MTKLHDKKTDTEHDHPPIFKSWNRLYVLLIVSQAVLIILFYLFSIGFQ